MSKLIAVLFVALLILHQDWWWWDDPTLVFGFMPVGLAYQALYSLLAAALWWIAVKFAWPEHIERFAEGGEAEGGPGTAGLGAGQEGRP